MFHLLNTERLLFINNRFFHHFFWVGFWHYGTVVHKDYQLSGEKPVFQRVKKGTPFFFGIAFSNPHFPPKAQKEWRPERKRKMAAGVNY